MPIHAPCEDEQGNVIRKVHGFLVRAPQHARSSTDRINIVTFEMVSKCPRSLAYLEKVQKPFVIDIGLDYVLVMRQNAVMKIDPSYLTFTANSLFTTANMVGEIILRNCNNEPNGGDVLRRTCMFIDENEMWLRNRNLRKSGVG